MHTISKTWSLVFSLSKQFFRKTIGISNILKQKHSPFSTKKYKLVFQLLELFNHSCLHHLIYRKGRYLLGKMLEKTLNDSLLVIHVCLSFNTCISHLNVSLRSWPLSISTSSRVGGIYSALRTQSIFLLHLFESSE